MRTVTLGVLALAFAAMVAQSRPIKARDLILARSGLDDIKLSNVQAQEYLDFASFATPVGISIPNQRGWTSVDVKVNGREVRFITTHLDQSPPIGAGQISE